MICIRSANIQRKDESGWDRTINKMREQEQQEKNKNILNLQESQTTARNYDRIIKSLNETGHVMIGKANNKAKIIINKEHFKEIKDLEDVNESSYNDNFNIIKLITQDPNEPNYIILNLYSPQENQSLNFYEEIQNIIRKTMLKEGDDKTLLIVVGDFNCTILNDKSDVSMPYDNYKMSNSANKVLEIMNENSLEDIFLSDETIIEHPDSSNNYTNQMSGDQRRRRLDKFLIQNNYFTDFNLVAFYSRTRVRIPQSTHFGIKLVLKTKQEILKESDNPQKRFHTIDEILKDYPEMKEAMRMDRHDIDKLITDEQDLKLYQNLCEDYDKNQFEKHISDDIGSEKFIKMFDKVMEKYQEFLIRETKNFYRCVKPMLDIGKTRDHGISKQNKDQVVLQRKIIINFSREEKNKLK